MRLHFSCSRSFLPSRVSSRSFSLFTSPFTTRLIISFISLSLHLPALASSKIPFIPSLAKSSCSPTDPQFEIARDVSCPIFPVHSHFTLHRKKNPPLHECSFLFTSGPLSSPPPARVRHSIAQPRGCIRRRARLYLLSHSALLSLACAYVSTLRAVHFPPSRSSSSGGCAVACVPAHLPK